MGKKQNDRQKKASTPKKIEVQQGRRDNRQSAFSLPTECIMGEGDFDFEKSNSMFDKQAEFEKIENGFEYEKPMERKPTKYRHDENVLPSQPTDLRQIKLPSPSHFEYVTGTMIYCLLYQIFDILSFSYNSFFFFFILILFFYLHYILLISIAFLIIFVPVDAGLVVPAISPDLRGRLIESAEQFGFSTERLVEQFGRSAAEMAMQLLGGNCR